MKGKLLAYALLTLILLATVHVAEAQQVKKVPRVGYIGSSIASSGDEAFREALRNLGYIERENVQVEYRYIEGQQDKVPNLIAELLELKVDVLVVSTLTSLRAAKQATNTIPIVMATNNDPVETGIVDSLARPGGNITGVTRLTRDLNGKRPEVLKEVVPKLAHVGSFGIRKGQGRLLLLKSTRLPLIC
jgi:putative tryptophan/tyrosine transport system substrate-binding protein